MSRRVIFPDPGIWNQERRTTMTDPGTLSAGDYRRAAALISHHRDACDAGIAAIIDEAHTAGRDTLLLLATLSLHERFLSELRTPAGRTLVADWVQAVGTLDTTGPVMNAARTLDAYHRRDIAAINDEITASGDAAPLMFACLLDLYARLIPELSSPAGMDWITRRAAAMAGEERAE